MSLVLDASMALSWLFEDEGTPASLAVMNRVGRDGAVTPAHWRLEVANALQVGVRRRRIGSEDRDASLADLSALPIETDVETGRHAWGATVRMADAHGLTLYDAAYLELAHRRGLPLATRDGALAEAARRLGLQALAG